MPTFTKDTALLEQGRGAARHGMCGSTHGMGVAWAQHAVCELEHGMGTAQHSMPCVNQP